MLGLLGKKVGMTRIFSDAGEPVPVTVVKAGPCMVVQVRKKDREGYSALQLGFETVARETRLSKAEVGHCKKAGTLVFRHLHEFKVDKTDEYPAGKELTVELFKKGDMVDLSGITKGKGYQGVIKRHGHQGGPAAHGSKFHRSTGSIGMRTWPGRVLPGTDMPGHMGSVKRTTKNLEVAGIDARENLLFIKGAVPGANNGLVIIKKLI